MALIGHDIVSLQDKFNAKSFADDRFIKKIMTQTELQYFHSSKTLINIPALFWSCKESVYKIKMKQGQKIAFVPGYFEIDTSKLIIKKETYSFQNISGTIKENTNVYYFKSILTNEYILSIACTDNEKLEQVEHKIGKSIHNNKSIKARNNVKNQISNLLTVLQHDIKFHKNEMLIPSVSINGNQSIFDISFSHDGLYYSSAILALI